MVLDPQLLEGREREVTILFSDIRNFTGLSEQLGPSETCRLVQRVMEHLTERVREFEGVVVDYYGDGLLAMWNAPANQPDHAALACRAALAMTRCLTDVNADWQETIGGPLEVGIGLNTGPALVGNTGSPLKFKYGPLGPTVNLASRVEGATKQLAVPVLVTGSTREQLGDQFAIRRLCQVRLAGVTSPVVLYELFNEEWTPWSSSYETALEHFEAGRWSQACEVVYPLLEPRNGGFDVPSFILFTRALECLKSSPKQFDPVLDFGSE